MDHGYYPLLFTITNPNIKPKKSTWQVLEKDLEKFLEGARLSKYLPKALDWCDEQGAASIEDRHLEALLAILRVPW